MRSLIPAAAAAAIILLLSGCTAGLTANAAAIEKAVNIQPSSGDPKPVATKTAVAVGETVKTDKAGLSEVTFADKSYTRVGPSSELTIVELSSADAQRTITSLDVGDSWHRVKKLTAEDSTYQVKTPVGTASVRGTAFAVSCTSKTECTFTVIEGVVEVKLEDGTKVTINPFERLTVPGTETVPFPVDAVKADEWIMRNLELDKIQLVDAVAAAGLDGTSGSGTTASVDDNAFHLVLTIVSSDDPRVTIGQTSESDWTFTTAGECTTEGCPIHIQSTSGREWDTTMGSDGQMALNTKSQVACFNGDTDEKVTDYGYDQTIETNLSPTGVEVVDGVPVFAGFEGAQTIVTTIKNPPDPSCTNPSRETSTETLSVALTRN